jgi:cysteine synthase
MYTGSGGTTTWVTAVLAAEESEVEVAGADVEDAAVAPETGRLQLLKISTGMRNTRGNTFNFKFMTTSKAASGFAWQ